MTVPDSLLQFAAMTTVVGMGVVFAALFLLSVYMHFFKVLIARLEERHREKAAPKPRAKVDAPVIEPVPPVQGGPKDDPTAQTAAALGVALHLHGFRAGPAGAVAAAIATVLYLHRSRLPVRVSAEIGSAAPGWGLAGRMAAMSARVTRQERVFR